MAEVVYVLGAGFNCSILDPMMAGQPPLARNFFNVFLRSRQAKWLDSIRVRPLADELMTEIRRYWKLDRSDLASAPFDIEECLTLFESQRDGSSSPDCSDAAARCVQAIGNMLVAFLGDLSLGVTPTPSSLQFGKDVLDSHADVLTFNYDTLAEKSLESAGGVTTNPDKAFIPSSLANLAELPYERLDCSHYQWNRNLAYGIRFGQLRMPTAGLAPYVDGERYYSHPANELYQERRVLKLHGSVSWFRYSGDRANPPGIDPPHSEEPPQGLVLAPYTPLWLDQLPDLNGWVMQPEIIPPQLYKNYAIEPYPMVWQHALASLAECKKLVVIGYSFPPTDFRVRRLFLEAFSEHDLRELTVINPDTIAVGVVRNLTHYKGPVISCSDLPSLYGLERSLIPSAPEETAAAPPK